MRTLRVFAWLTGIVLFGLSPIPLSQVWAEVNSTNLLRGHNPSFEQGFEHWQWYYGDNPDLIYSVSEYPAPNHCGSHVLKITQTRWGEELDGDVVMAPESGAYRFSLWLKMKPKNGEWSQISIYGYSTEPVPGEPTTTATLTVDRQTTHGKWKYLDTVFTDVQAGNRLQLKLFIDAAQGTHIFIDCAAIQHE